MSESEQQINRPSLFWLVTEGGRALTELGLSLPYRSYTKNKPKGDGHPILVLPGFMATDHSTKPMRRFLNKLGYNAYGWEMGRNFAKAEFIDQLIEKVEILHKSYGEEVTLIGWSLGGIFARQIAKARPEMIRQIITMGSPFRGVGKPNNAAWIYNFVSGGNTVQDVDPELIANIPLPAPVPTTAIYTKEDGVVPWELCLEDESPIHQNIQVRGSHLGLGVNMTVLDIIANRLQYRRGNWEQFEPSNIFEDLLFYPSL